MPYDRSAATIARERRTMESDLESSLDKIIEVYSGLLGPDASGADLDKVALKNSLKEQFRAA
ncbi:hypothetical protein [Alterinioella nitratireducens]|uniref:hypothetical protein n=1 Tax=Alterinioella nitratireducens TaxID=2735915 RepID=UPI0015519579|nr:hypothetical protein [Alterinioella nitratireducens]NPD18720.1 hypothetical protein [Alterinioella nitratireducens]